MDMTQALTLRAAHSSYVTQISRLSRPTLAVMYREELAARDTYSLHGGPVTKDELMSALVELRYPQAKLNESIHVLYHEDGYKNEVCEYCNPDPCPKCGELQGHCKYSPEHGGTVNGRHINV